jgi:DNA-directed RNA polymerase subunit RPC12/RpoP
LPAGTEPPSRTRDPDRVYLGAVTEARAATVPCVGCGAALPVLLGGQPITCEHCGRQQAIDADIEVRLRAHFHRVEALLEDAARVRAKSRVHDFARRRAGLGCLGVVLLVGGAVAFMTTGTGGVAYGAAGVMLAALAGLLVYLRVAPKNRAEMVDPVAGSVQCAACGASVPVVASTDSIGCPFCQRPLRLTPDAFAQTVAAAEESLASARRGLE